MKYVITVSCLVFFFFLGVDCLESRMFNSISSGSMFILYLD